MSTPIVPIRHVVYKIRNTVTGLYSKGGSDGQWSKNGKIWSGIGPLKLHFNVLSRQGRVEYRDAVVCEIEIVETECAITPTQHWVDQANARTAEREAEQAAHRASLRKVRYSK